MQQLQARVSGRVQGVGFRYFVREKARELGITGWTRNASDGSVEIVGEGEPVDLECFLAWVQQGPPLSRVDKVEKNFVEETSGYPEFVIRF
jgi:acylphosphatase